MRGERIQVRNFEEVRSQFVSEKDPVVKQKLSFLVVAGEDCLYLSFNKRHHQNVQPSPDLNPIEFVSMSIKRGFSRLAANLSFAISWIEKFIPSWI